MGKRSVFLMLVLLLFVPMQVFATEQMGSIHLTMRCDGTVVPEGKVVLYEISDTEYTQDAQSLAQVIRATERTGVIMEVDPRGEVDFLNLKPGSYLLMQEQSSQGYLPMKPFCVRIPLRIGNEQIYHIEATPKLEPIPENQLPQTGQVILPIWGLMGGGLVLVALGLLLQCKT